MDGQAWVSLPPDRAMVKVESHASRLQASLRDGLPHADSPYTAAAMLPVFPHSR